MKPAQEGPAQTVLEKLRRLEGNTHKVADAIADLEANLDDPIVAARVREALHGAATDPRHRDSWPDLTWHHSKKSRLPST